jgi:hypothetical protein
LFGPAFAVRHHDPVDDNASPVGDDTGTSRETIMQGDDIVRLARASNQAEAYLWQQALEEEGIPCKVVGDLLEGGIGDVPGIRPEVWVHRPDLERAGAFLEAHVRRGPAEETEVEEA